MNKKYIAIIISLVLIFSSVLLISGCNNDDENTTAPNGSTTVAPETEIASEDSSMEKTEGTAENETITDNKADKDESTTEIESQPPVNVEGTTVEHTSGKNEPVTCDVCGNLIVKDTGKGDLSVGNYCDGQCDEWFGELELE